MGKVGSLILKIFLGVLLATNFVVCIITTEPLVLVVVNAIVVVLCLGIFGFMASIVARLSREEGISRAAASNLIGAYFAHYKNVEKISLDEYLALTRRVGQGGG